MIDTLARLFLFNNSKLITTNDILFLWDLWQIYVKFQKLFLPYTLVKNYFNAKNTDFFYQQITQRHYNIHSILDAYFLYIFFWSEIPIYVLPLNIDCRVLLLRQSIFSLNISCIFTQIWCRKLNCTFIFKTNEVYLKKPRESMTAECSINKKTRIVTQSAINLIG